MNRVECEHIEDYLGRWLGEAERERFEAHLAGCPDCRRERERQRRIDLLLAQGARHPEPVPASLVDRIERQVRSSARRRRMQWAGGLAAAAMVLLAVGISIATRPPGNRPELRPIVQQPGQPAVEKAPVDPVPEKTRENRPEVRVVLSNPSDAILVRSETVSPNVSMVWVYPTVKPTPAELLPAVDSSPFD